MLCPFPEARLEWICEEDNSEDVVFGETAEKAAVADRVIAVRALLGGRFLLGVVARI